MRQITLYTKDYCPYCKAAKRLLQNKGLSYHELDITHNIKLQAEMRQRSQRRTVPQIFFDEQHVGGCDDLYRYFDMH
ncbi:glutaredoxin 3 [Corallincola luteus]|uniref:Glutaredoxin n=1 Tax=Corallincola luteus TaxID=1775177 RepID=A0ABY2AK79_9GAMM|nr:glutaredoxin 3 [Corallincola luteus]TCI02175.1 glutaredoxin 3 [Corallincola luteus]